MLSPFKVPTLNRCLQEHFLNSLQNKIKNSFYDHKEYIYYFNISYKYYKTNNNDNFYKIINNVIINGHSNVEK